MSGSFQRYTRDNRCPRCGHYGTDPSGHCHGGLTDGGAFARCTRANGSDGALLDEKCSPPAYVYRRQADGSYRPWSEHPPIQPTRAQKPHVEAHGATPSATEKSSGKTHPRPASTRIHAYSDTEGVEAVRRVAGGKKACYPRVRDHADAPWRDGKGIAPKERIYHRAALDARPDERVFVAEGEASADTLHHVGALAITWRGGCGQVRQAIPQIIEAVRGRDVVLLPDADAPGRDAMQQIAMALRSVARSVRIANLYGDESGRDIEDWLYEGGTVERLVTLTDVTPAYEPHGAENPPTSEWEPRIISLADVEPEQVAWLWPGYIALGKINLMDGDPGLGKSTLALDIAARVSTGGTMPDGTRSDLDGPAGVVVLSAEDGLADTMRPRLDAAGADVPRIVTIDCVVNGDKERGVTLTDLPAIETAIERVRARLLVVDPFMAYLGSETNSYRDQDVRGILAPLARLAERLGLAIVIIRHLSKGNSANVLYRGGGSIGIIGAARVGLMVGHDPEQPDGPRCILAVSKSNLAAIPSALAYHKEQAENGVARIVWEGATHHTAAAISATMQQDEEQRREGDEATRALKNALTRGRRPQKEVMREVRDGTGVSDSTIHRAGRRLGIKSEREGFGPGSVVYWRLPAAWDGAPPAPYLSHTMHTCHAPESENYGKYVTCMGDGERRAEDASAAVLTSVLPEAGAREGNGVVSLSNGCIVSADANEQPLSDAERLWQWVCDAQMGRASSVPEEVRRAAQRHGFAFDSFGTPLENAAALSEFLDFAGVR